MEIMTVYDTDRLLQIFKEEQEFIEYFVSTTFYLDTPSLENRIRILLYKLGANEKIPIRFALNKHGKYELEKIFSMDRKDIDKITELIIEYNFSLKISAVKFVPVSVDKENDVTIIKAI